jgi:hypothetical protein
VKKNTPRKGSATKILSARIKKFAPIIVPQISHTKFYFTMISFDEIHDIQIVEDVPSSRVKLKIRQCNASIMFLDYKKLIVMYLL